MRSGMDACMDACIKHFLPAAALSLVVHELDVGDELRTLESVGSEDSGIGLTSKMLLSSWMTVRF